MTTESKKLTPNGRIWIDTDEGPFLGYGRIEILEKIRETGSLRKASIEMKMSYQQAWNLIKQMNERIGEPLVLLSRGGSGGGSTLLTDKGEKAINAFHQFNEAFQLFLTETKIEF
ncbi:MAG: LysR family transcriptional regulator [Opitutaceae bacterium]|nr:LysR family transcriptional regulator [Cytophagales bacterium]